MVWILILDNEIGIAFGPFCKKWVGDFGPFCEKWKDWRKTPDGEFD